MQSTFLARILTYILFYLKKSKLVFQLTPCLLLVATVASFSLQAQAIRVDWGTNPGPIAPPPPRTTPQPPKKPYRDPAPVWEDQSDDIPNPNPYV